MSSKGMTVLYALNTPYIGKIEDLVRHHRVHKKELPLIFINDINVLNKCLTDEKLKDGARYQLYHFGGGDSESKDSRGNTLISLDINELNVDTTFDFILAETNFVLKNISLKEIILDHSQLKEVSILIMGENVFKISDWDDKTHQEQIGIGENDFKEKYEVSEENDFYLIDEKYENVNEKFSENLHWNVHHLIQLHPFNQTFDDRYRVYFTDGRLKDDFEKYLSTLDFKDGNSGTTLFTIEEGELIKTIPLVGNINLYNKGYDILEIEDMLNELSIHQSLMIVNGVKH